MAEETMLVTDSISQRKTRLQARRSGLSTAKQAELEKLLQGTSARVIPVRPADAPIPLTFAQERLWFLDQMEPGRPIYNIPFAFRISGKLRMSALRQGLDETLRRHEALRTNFALNGDRPAQAINDPAVMALRVVNLERLSAGAKEEESRRVMAEEAARPFNLAHGPLLRALLLRLGGAEHILAMTTHHIVSDGWSFHLWMQEVAGLYRAFCNGAPSPLPEPEIQYGDYALWQRQSFTQEVLASELAYWKKQLHESPVLLDLPTDRPRPAVSSFNGAILNVRIPASLTKQIRELNQSEGSTLFTTLLAGLNIVLSRHSGQQDIVIGTPVADRRWTETENLIGLFVNTLAMRTSLAGNPTITELLAREREVLLEAQAHQDLPFEKLVEELRPERSLSHSPLFQVMFVLQNVPKETLEVAGLTFSAIDLDPGVERFDLTLSVSESNDELECALSYNTDLFDASTAERIVAHFKSVLQSMAAAPGKRLSEISLLPATERAQVVSEWNQTSTEYPAGYVHECIEDVARKSPGAIAVQYEDQQLTYQQLDQRSNQLARYLRKLGAGPEVPVAICMERSLELVIGLLGIMKAGAAYVPLDPGYPQERVLYMLENSHAPVFMTQEKFAGLLPATNANVVKLDTNWESISKEQNTNPAIKISDENLVYVIYTSGSTGQPKGAMNTQQGLRNRLRWMQQQYGLAAEDSVLQKTPFSFDVSVWEFFWPLMVGARLVIARPGGHQDPVYLAETIEKSKITTLHFVPSMLRAFLNSGVAEKCKGLRRIICSGEALSIELARECQERIPAELHNLYGPTEASIDVTYWNCAESSEAVLIGKPIANNQVYVLDSEMQPVPVGIGGELYLGGAGLGRGYLQQSSLTAEKFVPNPFGKELGSRLYRTGDWVRWRANGNLEFLGRRDEQVKLRGNRIELGEIEAALRQHPFVTDAAVLVREDNRGEKRLTAYVVAGNEQPFLNGALRKHLQEKLPEYMVPELFVPLERLPLTPTGKLDRRALPQPGNERPLNSEFVAPTTLVQEVVAAIWADVLGVAKIGKADNFFQLGGHSLLAIQVVSRLREAFNAELPVRSLFESPSLEQFSGRVQQIMRSSSAQPPSLRLVPRDGTVLLSYAQQRLWFLDQLTPNGNAYNIPVSVRFNMQLNVNALEDALSETVRRHEILRTTFGSVEGQPIQIIAPATKTSLKIVDLSSLEESEREAELQKLARLEALRPFDLANGPLLRTCLVRMGDQSHVELLTLHHIITDGWSMGVLMQEVESSYRAFLSGNPSELPELAIQYADFAAWQRDWLEDGALAVQLNYWKRQLEGAPMLLALPTDYPRPSRRSLPGIQCPISFSESFSKRLRELCKQEGTTPFMVLMAAFQLLLGRYTAQDEVLVGTPAVGRGQVELENLIGFFVNMIVLKANLGSARSVRDLLRQVRETALDAYAYQDVPFDRLVEELKPERRNNRNPIFQAVLAFQNAPTPGMEMAGVTLPSGSPGHAETKFDLELYFWETATDFTGSFVFSPEIFRASTISRMANQLSHLLEVFVSQPDARLSDISLVTGLEYGQITEIWNETEVEFPGQSVIHEVFAKQVQMTPDAIAIETDQEQISYRELDRRSSMVANYLSSLGAGPEVFVGVLFERSLDMIVALLATLKSGAVYVPINPADPIKRIEFILQDARISLLLTSKQIAQKVPAGRLNVVCLDGEMDRERMVAVQSNGNAAGAATFDNLAYMIYTSGSTGHPKGVCVTHRNVLRLVKGASYVDLTSREVFLQFAPVSFDASTFEIWGALLNGARLVLFPPHAPSLRELGEFIRESGITTMWLTAGLFHQVIDRNMDGIRSVKQLLAGGEALSVTHVNKLLAESPDCTMVNGYGPTETTTFACCHRVGANHQGTTVPIGRPIANTKVYVLNEGMRLAAIGETGELFIGGAGLARGYLNRPDFTAERFVPDPFSNSGGRLYRTGDLVRYLEDGNIEFLGRADKQIKLRGFRIELEEIEKTLSEHPQVEQAVVIPRDDSAGGKRLVAYIVPVAGSVLTVERLRSHVQERLPEYMVPSLFLVLEQLPLTANGKVDANALLRFDRMAARSEKTFVAPKDRLQEQLITIWEGLLDARPIGIQDDFFELGGHSLIAVQLIARIEQELGKRLPMAALFEGATIERISQLLRDDTGSAGADSSIVATIQPNGTRPPLFCVHAAGGTVFCYTDLAKHLGQDQPVYGIQAPPTSDTAVQTLETMASEYIKALRGFQPRGPYFLGGWSMGGVIAFEMARQMIKQGEKVALLFLVDAQAPTGESAEYNWVVLLGSFAVDIGIPFDYLKSSWDKIFSGPPMEQLRRIWSDAKKQKLISSDMTLADFRKLFDHFKTNAQMAKSYAGAEYPGRITFFRAVEPEEYVGKARPKNYVVAADAAKAWEKWAEGGIEILNVPGQHFTVMREPYVSALAEQLRVCIQKVIEED
jgi:amino acid adenylation domain-containing protein